MISTMNLIVAENSPLPTLTLNSVTFGGGWRINKDSGPKYDKPEWTAGPSPVAPYLYASTP